LTELAVVLAIISVLGLLGFGAASRAKAKADRIECSHHLNNLGIARTAQRADQGLRTLYETARNTPGKNIDLTAWQLVQASYSNSVPTGQWVCPADTRKAAADWASVRNDNLSYFMPLDPSELSPEAVLGGDRNVALNGVPIPAGVADFSKGTLSFTDSIHRRVGSLAMGGGSIQSTAGILLRAKRETRVVVP